MTLGTPIVSWARMQIGKIAFFAHWDNELALDTFLQQHAFGVLLKQGWHVRMQLLYQWGTVSELQGLKLQGEHDDAMPIVSVTLARLKLSQTVRFTHWGKPVERFVRDHPGNTLALAAYRPFNTLSTFTLWRTQKEMKDMVFGNTANGYKNAHSLAMKERVRKDFHHEFTTLRFRAIAEQGQWQGQQNWVPAQ